MKPTRQIQNFLLGSYIFAATCSCAFAQEASSGSSETSLWQMIIAGIIWLAGAALAWKLYPIFRKPSVNSKSVFEQFMLRLVYAALMPLVVLIVVLIFVSG